MIIDLRLNEQAQEAVEQAAAELQVHLLGKEGEVYDLTELEVVVEEWLEAAATDLLADAVEHLFRGSSSTAIGRHHLKDALAKLQSQPLKVPAVAAVEAELAAV